MKKILLILPLFLLMAIPSLAIPINYSASIYDLADSDIYNGSSSNLNDGTAQTLALQATATYFARSYMKWATTMIPSNATLNSAYLYLYYYGTDNGAERFALIYNTSLNWNETNITWNNAPNSSVLVSNNSISGSTNRYIKFNVTSAMQYASDKGLPMSIMIKFDQETIPRSKLFYSKERVAQPPILEVDYVDTFGCGSHLANGTWCDNYNRTPMCTDYVTSNCWDPYTETFPNPFNASNNAYTTFTNSSGFECGIYPGTCPSGYMCIQGAITEPTKTYGYPIYTTSLGNNWTWGPYVICHSDQSLIDIYINSTGQNDTLINVDPGITASSTCENPTIWNNNSFACILDGCHYCTQESVCKKLTNSCINTCFNDTSIGKCFDSFCNPVTCLQGTGGNSQIGRVITTYFGVLDETTATFYSILISVIVGVIIMILISQLGVHGAIIGQSFIIIVLLSLVAFTVIGMFPSWLMIVLMVIAGLIVAKSLQVV